MKSFKLSEIAITKPATIYLFILLMVYMGVNAYNSLPRESTPDIQIPYLFVSVPFPGASPEDVEALIIHKLETEFQNLEYLKEMKSTSAENVGIVSLEFDVNFNIDDARTKVREALDTVKPDLPTDAEDPVITEVNFSEQPIMIINISGKQGLFILKNIAEDIKDRIESVQGVLEVKRTGGLEREIQVAVDPFKLSFYKLDLNQILSTIKVENINIPGGNIEIDNMKFLIRVPGEIKTPEEINHMVITSPNGSPVYISDVAKVTYGFKEVTNRSRLNDIESVSLSVSKRSGENLTRIAKEVKKIINEEKERFKGHLEFSILADQSKRINNMIKDLENNIFTGFIFVALTLLFFLGARSALLVSMAIPFSMLISFVILQWCGITLNMVVLFSLILALGMLVDNAIVVVENIYRHYGLGKTRIQASIDGVSEVAIPVITSTITTLVVFFPLLYMPGIIGQFMSYLPKTLIITLSSSLFVGLFLNPVMCSNLMEKELKTKKSDSEKENTFFNKVVEKYKNILIYSLKHRGMVIGGVIFFWFFSIFFYFIFTFPRAGVEFFPETEPEEAIIHIKAPVGATLDASDKIIHQIEDILRPYQQYTEAIVSNVGKARSGLAASSESTWENHIVLSFPYWEEWKKKPSDIIAEIRPKLKKIAGAKITFEKAKMGPPTGKAINIELSGPEFKTLKDLTHKIEKQIKEIPGLVNLENNFDAASSEFRIIFDREKISRFKLNSSQVGKIIRTAFNGTEASTYRVGKDEYDIIVRLDEQFRQSSLDLKNLYIMGVNQKFIQLSELAKIESAPAYGSIQHVNSKRVITISADAHEVPGPVVLQKVKKRLEKFKLPQNYSINYTGENKEQNIFQDYLSKSFFIAILLIFIVLVTQFDSIVLPAIILVSVILSLMGVFLGMIIHTRPLSIMMGGIGIISLAGIVVNNAIVLIDYIQQLRKEGRSVEDAIITAGITRLRPVLITAITTILGLLPIAMKMDINIYRLPNIILFGSEGGSFWMPMAYSVIYGLLVATILTLIVVPILYSCIESLKKVDYKQIYQQYLTKLKNYLLNKLN